MERRAPASGMPVAVKPSIDGAGARRSRTLRFAASGSMPSNERMISRGAAAAHACGEHDEGYGMGAARSSASNPAKSSGRRPLVNVDARRRSSARSAAL